MDVPENPPSYMPAGARSRVTPTAFMMPATVRKKKLGSRRVFTKFEKECFFMIRLPKYI